MNTYDMTFIFLTSLGEEAREGVLTNIRGEIESHGGVVLGTKKLGRRTFARPMKRADDGVFVGMSLTLPPDQVDSLKDRFRLMLDIFRVQILRTEQARYVAAPEPVEALAEPAEAVPAAEGNKDGEL